MKVSEYAHRKRVEGAILDAWAHEWVSEGATTRREREFLLSTAGVLAAATGLAYMSFGTAGALGCPMLLAVPLATIIEEIYGTNDTVADMLQRRKPKARAMAGLRGVRDPELGPSLLERLSNVVGLSKAVAVLDRAAGDLEGGFWGKAARFCRYLIKGDVVEPVTAGQAAEIAKAGTVRKAVFQEDGAVTIATYQDGIPGAGHLPSVVHYGPGGAPVLAQWHADGEVSRTWREADGPFPDCSGSEAIDRLASAVPA